MIIIANFIIQMKWACWRLNPSWVPAGWIFYQEQVTPQSYCCEFSVRSYRVTPLTLSSSGSYRVTPLTLSSSGSVGGAPGTGDSTIKLLRILCKVIWSRLLMDLSWITDWKHIYSHLSKVIFKSCTEHLKNIVIQCRSWDISKFEWQASHMSVTKKAWTLRTV